MFFLVERVGEFFEGILDEFGFFLEVGGEEVVGVGDGDEGGFEGVFEGFGGIGGGGVGVFDISELEEVFDGGGGNEVGIMGSGDELLCVIVSYCSFMGVEM